MCDVDHLPAGGDVEYLLFTERPGSFLLSDVGTYVSRSAKPDIDGCVASSTDRVRGICGLAGAANVRRSAPVRLMKSTGVVQSESPNRCPDAKGPSITTGAGSVAFA